MHQQFIQEQVAQALFEDLNGTDQSTDITAQLIPEQQQARGKVITRQDAVICGVEWVNETLAQVDGEITIDWLVKDGDAVKANDCLFTFEGPARGILTAERTALNFLQTLSATATQTAHYVNAVKKLGSKTQILDTRKTLPGLRFAQKYAVTCGGGKNHRIGLFDAFLIKENHIQAAGGITSAVQQAKKMQPEAKVEVEVESLEELQLAIDAGADIIMLDNFTVEMTAHAKQLSGDKVKLEASGNMDGEKFKAYAELNVDYISIGGLTKHIDAIDLSMRFDPA